MVGLMAYVSPTRTLSSAEIDAGVKATHELDAIIADFIAELPDRALGWMALQHGQIGEAAHAEVQKRADDVDDV